MKGVILAHLILVGSLLLWREPARPPAMKVTTRTIMATPTRLDTKTKPVSTTTSSAPSSSLASTAPDKTNIHPSQKKASPSPKKETSTKQVSAPLTKKKNVEAPQKPVQNKGGNSPAASSTRSTQAAQAVAVAKQALQTLHASPSMPSSTPAPTSAIGTLQSERWAYEEILSSFLMQTLVLPEPFDVVVSLTVQRNGTIGTCTVLESVSATNRQYVATLLPTLRVPPLEAPWNQGPSHTFSIRLQPQQKG